MATTAAISGIRAGFSWNTEKTSNIANVSTINSGGFSYSKSFNSTALADPSAVSDVVSKFYVDEFVLAPSVSKAYDLSGNLTDVFGQVISMTKVRYIYIELIYLTAAAGAEASATDSEGITIGGGTFASIFSSFMGITPSAVETTKSPTILLQAGGCFQLCSGTGLGYAITSATLGDTLLITNNPIGAAQSGVASVRVCFAGV